MKEFKIFILVLVVLGVLISCTNNQAEEHKARIVEKCGGEENVTFYYTKEGDKFYTCKVEK